MEPEHYGNVAREITGESEPIPGEIRVNPAESPNEELARQQKVMRALYEIAGITTESSTIETICPQLHLAVSELMNVSHFSVALWDTSNGTINFPYLVDRSSERYLARSQDTLREIAGDVIRSVTGRELATASSRTATPSASEDAVLAEDVLGIPLVADGFVLGALLVAKSEAGTSYAGPDKEVLAFVAQQLASAVSRARAMAAERQRINELTILNSVGEAMARTLDPKIVTRLVGDKVRDIFDAESVLIMLLEPSTNLIHVPYEYDLSEGGYLENVEPFPLGTGLASKVINSGKPLLLSTLEEEIAQGAYFPPELLQQSAASLSQSWLGVPIVVNDEAVGVLALADQRPYAYNENHLRLLQTLSASVGVAIENARLFEAEQQRVAELDALNRVSTALASELDLNTLIFLAGEQTRRLFNADTAYVALLDQSGEAIHFPYTYGDDLTSMPYGQGLTSRIIESNTPVLINEELDRQIPEIGAIVVGQQPLSYLGVPIRVRGNAVGVLSVQSVTREGIFDARDADLLATIASNVGSALGNARLYAEARRARADAEQANASKSAFLANMSHELRTPLNAIIGFTRIVRRKTESLIPERQQDNLDKVLVSAENLLSLINTVLDIAKIEAGRMDVLPANFRVAALIDLCANTAQPLVRPGVSLEKEIDEALSYAYSDQDKIRQIVLNLLSNAAKFTSEGTITLSAWRDGEANFCISVRDTGIGISAEAVPRIFKEFEQADSSTTRNFGGTGLGLAISRNLARLLGGDLTAESMPGRGSTFTLSVPLHYTPPVTEVPRIA